MELADYQKRISDQIYDMLLENEENRCINLYGDVGCGKTTIAVEVMERLKEGWSVYYLSGISPELSPYLTWHIGTKLASKKLSFDKNISFGVPFLPAGISFNMNISEFNPIILTPCEDTIVNWISKHAGDGSGILFVADNFELWDIPSKQLLQKIMTSRLQLLKDFHLVVMVLTSEQIKFDCDAFFDTICIPEIPDEDMLFILRQQEHSGQINLEKIRLCAGNDLSLALIAADYYEENDLSCTDFNKLFDKRFKSLSDKDQKSCEILKSLSVLDSCFTKHEAAFFLDDSRENDIITEYQAEDCLAVAEGKRFIAGDENYYFTDERIKSYFREQISEKARIYHRKFAYYLKKNHPEDYFSRGKHLKCSIKKSDTSVIFESWQLFFLAYMRRSAQLGYNNDVYNILSIIRDLLDLLPLEFSENQKNVLERLQSGYKAFLECEYEKAIYEFQSITCSRLIPACHAEVKRLILLCYVQLADNHEMIRLFADELYDIVNDDNFAEDEEYCRAALVLMDIYIDRCNNVEKERLIHKNFIQIVQRHQRRSAFNELEACYNRKSALYYSALVAYRQTAQSIQYYRAHMNHTELYMSLCNHSGNAIISADYNEAEKSLQECNSMLQKQILYPSRYKVENNTILLKYLKKEKAEAGNEKSIIEAAKEAAESFAEIMNHQQAECSMVILFNYLGLSALADLGSWEEDLRLANQQLTVQNAYYMYFLQDLNFAYGLLKRDLDEAQKAFTQLTKIKVPLFRNYPKIFLRRRQEQERLLNSPGTEIGSAYKYHELITNACMHVQDPSCHFWGRGFLLSDLQFLSL